MYEPVSISDAAVQIQSGRLAPRDLVERCLEQIDKYEERVHAWVAVDAAAARQTARRLGQEVARGNYRAPLHGIPVGIKDIVDVEGFPTRAGSPLTDATPKRSDAPLVAALRQAGAIILGKTVTCEFACFDPSPTRNPWGPKLEHTPGGSSSGSAVAVALGMCLAAIGTQTGGSLVRPASYCGVAAYKPTFGRLQREGIVPVSYHLDHPGTIARTASDLQCVLRHLTDLGDADSSEAPTPPRLGLIEPFFLHEADEPIRRATEEAIRMLRRGGARIRPMGLPPGFEDLHRMHRRIMAVEAAAYHRESFPRRAKPAAQKDSDTCSHRQQKSWRKTPKHRGAYGPAIAGLLEEGLATSAVDYAAALAHQRAFQRAAREHFMTGEPLDALIMPATDTTAPATLQTTGDPKLQSPWSYAGLPVVSIPCGLASDGMPAALQLVGRPDLDGRLLRVAQWCEGRLGFRELPPLLT